jgi:3D (Asp-Asp-Asp) domain-containing protein
MWRSLSGLLFLATCATCTLVLAEAEPDAQSKRSRSRRALTVWATAYCIDGTTKSGAQTRDGVIAADPKLLPLGSLVRIHGLGQRRTYTVLDTGPAVKGREIDIFMSDCRKAKRFGRRQVRLEILRSGDGGGRGRGAVEESGRRTARGGRQG